MSSIINFINAALRPVKSRISAMIGRGVLSLVDDQLKMQLVQCSFLDEETRDKLENFQPYGFTYHAQPGAEVVALFPQGNRDHGIVVCIADRRFRLKELAAGEVALYTDEGDYFYFKRGNKVELKTSNFKVMGNVEITGTLQAAGVTDTSTSVSIADIKTKFNAHVHSENGTGGGITSSTGTPL